MFGCPVLEARFAVTDVSVPTKIIGTDFADREINESQLTAINETFGTTFDAAGRRVSLSQWDWARTAPYLIHHLAPGFEPFSHA